MADKIQHDSAQHLSLKTSLQKLQTSFEEVITSFNSVKSLVSSEFKGESSDALKTALQQKIEQLNKEKTDWQIVIENADKLEAAFVETDEKIAKEVASLEIGSGNRAMM